MVARVALTVLLVLSHSGHADDVFSSEYVGARWGWPGVDLHPTLKARLQGWQRRMPLRVDGGDPADGPWMASLGKVGSGRRSMISGHELRFSFLPEFDLRAAYGNYNVQHGLRYRQQFDAWQISFEARF